MENNNDDEYAYISIFIDDDVNFENIEDSEFHENYDNDILSKLCNVQLTDDELIKIRDEYFKSEKQLTYYYAIISKFQKLSEEFIDRYGDKLDWSTMGRFQKLTENQIEKNIKDIGWDAVYEYQKITEAFIEKYKHKINWYLISNYQKLSESFIEKYKDKVAWKSISANQILSEAFIEKYKDEVDWYYILLFQKLSYDFLEKHLYNYNLATSLFTNVNTLHLYKLQKKYPHKYEIDKLEEELNKNGN